MHPEVDKVCTSLEKVANAVKPLFPQEKTLREAINWQFPLVTGAELADRARSISSRLREAEIDDLDAADVDRYREVARRVQLLSNETVPNMVSHTQAISAYLVTLDHLERMLWPEIGLTAVDDPKLLPAKTANRLRNVNRMMDRIDQGHGELAQRVDEINRAYSAAQELPTTLQELDEASISLNETKDKIEAIVQGVTKVAGRIETSEEDAAKIVSRLSILSADGDKLIAQCEAAYQITTTKGLAGAFDQRAKVLNTSIIFWVVGLLSALVIGAEIGTKRIEVLSGILANSHPDWAMIILHVVLSLLSVGGPLWFAWLATKQIGQRFRLAEDYAYKASVAKAYEGYRKQAANLDPAFAARLFSTALTRLEEAPLRLVEPQTHGSPWHEFLASESVQKALATVPGFQQQVVDIAKKALDTVGDVAKSQLKSKAEQKKTEDKKAEEAESS